MVLIDGVRRGRLCKNIEPGHHPTAEPPNQPAKNTLSLNRSCKHTSPPLVGQLDPMVSTFSRPLLFLLSFYAEL